MRKHETLVHSTVRTVSTVHVSTYVIHWKDTSGGTTVVRMYNKRGSKDIQHQVNADATER